MAGQNILIVEDEELMRSILRRLLEAEGFAVLTADSAETALRIFSSAEVSVTLSDIKMAGMDGIELLDQIKTIDRDALVIIMTAFSSVDSAIAALRKGAYDYITKPFVNDDLVKTVRNAIAQHDLFRENRALRRELNRESKFDEMIGKSTGLKGVTELIEKIADTNTTVLIQGESGTGKELVARALHFNSRRAGHPFLAVNCGAIPEDLLESELFGHSKGAFTGAVNDKAGLFRAASGGTVFLDEIAELPLALQSKLLRAIQEREVTPVGTSTPVKFDARIVAATNRDLEKEVNDGRFREDLFYRLNVVEIDLPSLRERTEDIPLLVRYFSGRTARGQNLPEKPITIPAMEALTAYAWPGNIRELENAVERAFILSGDEITVADLPKKVVSDTFKQVQQDVEMRSLEDVERDYVAEVMKAFDNDKVRAARVLGIDLSTLYRKLKRYDEI
ncbi:MAG TPA: sigma-54 dependent transcriptional regulator [Pyrinomonadaceae bacterium]|nr:sigma-54 dependent transcriptional regulator [Pyrinomonadaceae bacterium]HRK49474.1 sigma-54 dependent transcriptional regulator [Pyrinomonadaceae bacterium]